jgi:hypothetical protein
MLPSDPDRMVHDPFFLARHCMPARATVWLGFRRNGAYRGVADGRRGLVRRRRGSVDEAQPAEAHAEGVVLAMVSVASRWVPVMVGGVGCHGESWSRSKGRLDLGDGDMLMR